MADFAANLVSVPGILVGPSAGGSSTASLVGIPSFPRGSAFGPGSDAFFLAIPPVILGALSLGWVAAIVLAPDTVLSPRAINRVYDATAGKNVTWVTDGGDPNGVFYPGPGVYGINTSLYVLVAYVCSG